MKKIVLIFTLMLPAACSTNPLGQSQSDCDKYPESCSSVREAYKNSNGPVAPVASEKALQRADTMRVWVAPMRTDKGVLTNSGHVYFD